jgi:ABC-type Zn uptake system ZnuABC Zn-binding protein ZnuA
VVLSLLVAATISVAATSTDLRSLVVAVGGDRVAVQSLTDPRHDPHAREVTPQQLAGLQGAALLVRIGLDHEPWLVRAVASAGRPPHDLDCSRVVTLLGTDPASTRRQAGGHVHGYGNPHYWLDPENARPITGAMVEALVRIAPDDRAAFEENRRRFLARLDAGLARWREALRLHQGARLVTLHDTWPYLARRFGLVVVATVEERPGVPPSPAYLGELMDRMKRARVRVLVVEPNAASAVTRRIADGTGARVVTLAPSVGAEPEATDYLALFDLNVRRLAAALL